MADSDFVTEGQLNALVAALAAANGGGGGGASVFSYCQYRNTDTTTNVNQASPIVVPMMGTVDHSDPDYTLGTNVITCNFDGTVEIAANMAYSGSATRVNAGLHIEKNATQVSGLGLQGYIRNSGGHNEACTQISCVVDVANGDEIQVIATRWAGSATVTQIAGASSISIVRLA